MNQFPVIRLLLEYDVTTERGSTYPQIAYVAEYNDGRTLQSAKRHFKNKTRALAVGQPGRRITVANTEEA